MRLSRWSTPPRQSDVAEDAVQPIQRLTHVACGLLVALPPAMTAANRSATLIITLAALAAAGALFANVRRELGPQPLSGIEPLRLFYMLAITIAALAWLSRGADLTALGEAFVSVLAGAIVIASLERPLPRWLPVALAIAIGASGLWLVTELEGGMLVRRLLGLRTHTFIFNRTVVTLTLLLWPALALLALAGRISGNKAYVYGCGALILIVGYTVIRSDSGAATFGLAIGLMAFVVAHVAPRPALVLAGAGFLACLMLAPGMGTIANGIMPPKMHEQLASSHSRDRVEIWQSFGAAISHATAKEVLLGQGFGTSARMADMPIADAVPTERRVLLGVGHPHNAYLQIWVELGLTGALVASGLLFLVLRSLWHLPTSLMAPRLALLASAGVIALVGHGAWQGWWIAALGAAWALFPSQLNEASQLSEAGQVSEISQSNKKGLTS
jgi:O-antigen ligase